MIIDSFELNKLCLAFVNGRIDFNCCLRCSQLIHLFSLDVHSI